LLHSTSICKLTETELFDALVSSVVCCAGFNGDDSFTYTLTDCDGDTATAAVSLRFVRPPTATADTINWKGSQTKRDAPGVLANDVYPGCPLSRVTVEVVEEAKWGQVQLNSDGAWVYIARSRPGEGLRVRSSR
jgi:hypothetical protein